MLSWTLQLQGIRGNRLYRYQTLHQLGGEKDFKPHPQNGISVALKGSFQNLSGVHLPSLNEFESFVNIRRSSYYVDEVIFFVWAS